MTKNISKQIIVLLGYLTIILQVFSIGLPIFSRILFGYTIKYILFYGFILLSLTRWIVTLFLKRLVKYNDLFLFLYIIGPLVVGLIMGWGIGNIITEGVIMLMPIAVYAWCSQNRLSMEKYIYIYQSTVIVAAIVSILVALRIISTNIWAAQGQFVRAAGAVDSTIFVGGYLISYVMLFVSPEKKGKYSYLLSLTALIFSIVGLLFTQSRMRIVLILVITGILIVYNIFNKRSKFGNLRFLALAIVIGMIVLAYQPEILTKIVNQVALRFSSITDVNVISREQETTKQLECFMTSPVFGLGWGSRSQFSGMYVHNLYSSTLMQCGLLFGGCLAIWFFSFVSNVVKIIKRDSINTNCIISMLFILCLLILGYTNAGYIQSGGYYMMLLVYINDKEIKTTGKRVLS